ncbi:MAG TPA: hypothetical protein VKQ28_08615 [Candidatus Acidoferrum sp.]|nr:hypothetical protein [Candidatus Acidoferrum sp.]
MNAAKRAEPFRGSASTSNKPFVVDMPAPLLKRNADLSNGARHLYATARALANGRTGELRIRNRWLAFRFICFQAGICIKTGRKYWKELLVCGWVSAERERVARVLCGRLRSVGGRAHYTVHRQPKTERRSKRPSPTPSRSIEKRPFLQRSNSSFREELPPQRSQTHQAGAIPTSLAISENEFVLERESANHHLLTGPKSADDDTFPVSETQSPNHFEEIQDRAVSILLAKGEDPEFVAAAIQFIDERSESHGKTPATANYYLRSFAALKHNSEEMDALYEVVRRKRSLREKYMPGFTGHLSPESERLRREFNRTVASKTESE